MSSETFTPENLRAGDYPIVTDEVTIVSGQNLVKGSVIGKITASGKYKLTDYPATDGSEKPVFVLAQDIDASGGDVSNAGVYASGEFSLDKLVWGASTDATSTISIPAVGTTSGVLATMKEVLRDVNIYLKDAFQVDP